ncbi:MAG: Cys/Met metabolism pyridoxal-phosphate-dependent protein, partial [Acidobacteriaceae bacterium]|nr:Cys/Met metabolism pyridoxal-phosphate-dependent protein [Acidobacteriaceae bacterium]
MGSAPALLARRATALPDATHPPSNIYQKIGVRPVINCRGTYTIIGGSLELPEVTAAQQAAGQHYVQLDELADGIGQRLVELTGAEWGMVSAGCAAGLAHATSACVAGGNPDLHVRIPDLRGFPKDEVVIPAHSRNEYDAAVRSIGVRIVEVQNAQDFQ